MINNKMYKIQITLYRRSPDCFI